jgi:hypothetical protein
MIRGQIGPNTPWDQIGQLCLGIRKIGVFLVLEYQTSIVDSWWYIRDVDLGLGNRRTSPVVSDLIELGQMVASKAIGSWTQALLKIDMIALFCAKSPYLACLCRCLFSTTAKPNFITRKQQNYKSL